jgi:mRNA deadenylase 3'-5' endonuclease subunit Ccr4
MLLRLFSCAPTCSFNSYCPPQFLSWQYRYPKLLAELELYAADLLFLQEVESTVFDQQLQPWMQQRGYNSLFQPRRSPQGTFLLFISVCYCTFM